MLKFRTILLYFSAYRAQAITLELKYPCIQYVLATIYRVICSNNFNAYAYEVFDRLGVCGIIKL